MTDHNHKTLSCDKLLGMLSDYLEGQAREEVCKEIESHIAGCNNCRVVVDTTQKTISLVHACDDKPINLPSDVRERLFKRLDLGDYLNPGH